MRSTKALKKLIAMLLVCVSVLTLLCACTDPADQSNDPSDTSSEQSNTSSAEPSKEPDMSENSEVSLEPIDPDPNASKIWKSEYADSTIASADDVANAVVWRDGAVSDDYSAVIKGDVKYLFAGRDHTRVVNNPEGYAITLPGNDIKYDFSLSAIRCKFFNDDYCLTVTSESSNPYGNNANGWNIYNTEWLSRYIANDSYLTANTLMRTAQTKTYTDLIDGFEATVYCIKINNDAGIEMPYYTIAVIKRPTEYVQFYLLVLKSKQKMNDDMLDIVSSFSEITKLGKSANTQNAYELKYEENWNDETKAYFDKIMQQDTVDWGFYHLNLEPRSSSQYFANQKKIAEWLNWSVTNLDYSAAIYPTYTHIGFGSSRSQFPTDQAKEFAGGNGFNGKPVLQMSYQFTTSNNVSLDGYTPMFDILRGKYDDQFRSIAKQIKAYGAPVWFRLNNEMNSDWVSYCGIVTLLDPDIFIMTWQRMYDIFIEEGVDNCIFVFNPIAVDVPYSSWGNYLNYFPGADYCQAYGLTYYEMINNAPNEKVTYKTFKEMYTYLYDKSMPYFDKYPWVIGEFGCASGGEAYYDWGINNYVSTVLGRNADQQAQWITDMFTYLEDMSAPESEFISRLKYAVWFSVNDYAADGRITNYLDISNAEKAIAAFKAGLKKTQK